MRILACDDDPAIRKLLAIAVGRIGGHTTYVTDDPADLIDALATPADVVFLDLNVGAVSGLDIGRRIRQAGHSVPIVFLTGSPESLIGRLGSFAPAGVVGKPFDVRTLVPDAMASIGLAGGGQGDPYGGPPIG